jgi:low affinity Fe/Cu permease
MELQNAAHVEPRIKQARVEAGGTEMAAKKKDHNGQATNGHRPSRLSALFSSFAQKTAMWTGHPLAFLIAMFTIVVWVVTGPMFHYSDTWQLVINTGTTIVTFLMVFLIQNTQNRDMLAVQLKLSELVLAMEGAKNSFAAIEDLTDEELQALHIDCRQRAEMAEQHIEHRQRTTPVPDAAKPPAKNGKSTERSASPAKA